MTRQIPDKLIYLDKELFINVEILEPYFEKYPERKFLFTNIASALWRGYHATFVIEEGYLKVIEIQAWDNLPQRKLFNTAFPDGGTMYWYSGFIRIDEDRGWYDDESPGMNFEFLQIKNGKLVKHWRLNYDELLIFKLYLFDAFVLTEDYNILIKKWRANNPKWDESAIDEIILEDIFNHVREGEI